MPHGRKYITSEMRGNGKHFDQGLDMVYDNPRFVLLKKENLFDVGVILKTENF